jgi:hypothetical protein
MMGDDRTLRFKYEKAKGKTLVIVENFPGLDAELWPEELLKMSKELAKAAEHALALTRNRDDGVKEALAIVDQVLDRSLDR